MQKCPVPRVPPNCKWDNPVATRGCRERHAAPTAPHTSSGERASRKRKSPKLGGTQAAKQLGAHGSETSPNRTHNNTQGNHEVRALQQPPNAAHAERAISKPHPLPPPSTRCPHTPQGPELRHGAGNRAVTSQPRTGQSTLYGDVKSSYGGRPMGQEGVRDRGTQERQQTGGGAT